MALEVADFVSPLGEVQQSMFPGETLTTIIDGLLTKAVELQPDDETLQEAFVYWKIYTAVANRFASELMSETRNKVSRSRGESQFKHWRGKALFWEKAYACQELVF